MLPKEKYALYVKRPYPPFPSSMVLTSWASEAQHRLFLPVPFSEKNNFLCDSDWYFVKEDVEKGVQLVFQHWSNPFHFKQGKRLLQQREKELLQSTKKDLPTFCAAFEAFIPAMHLIWFCEKVGDEIRALLQEKVSSLETEEIMNYVSLPLRDNYYKKEEYDLAKCQNLKSHVKKYEWILSRYGEKKSYTLEQAQEKKNNINEVEFFQRYDEEKKIIKEKIALAKIIVGKEKSHFIDWFQFIIFYRTQRTDVLNRALYQAIPMLEEEASLKHLTYQELVHCTKDELFSEIPPLNILHERMKSFAMLMEEGVLRCVQGEEVAKIKKSFQEDLGGITEIKGSTACPGKVTGIVKIVNSSKDFSKINNRDILVASMTTPDMMIIMHKAAAFVTDEGGITCHAAIVSREMHKPCIVGTEIATKVLKDGDWVEVDATKGIVKKVKL